MQVLCIPRELAVMCSEEEGVLMTLLFTILCVLLFAITGVAFVFLLRDTACDDEDDFQCLSDLLYHDHDDFDIDDPFGRYYSNESYSPKRNSNEV